MSGKEVCFVVCKEEYWHTDIDSYLLTYNYVKEIGSLNEKRRLNSFSFVKVLGDFSDTRYPWHGTRGSFIQSGIVCSSLPSFPSECYVVGRVWLPYRRRVWEVNRDQDVRVRRGPDPLRKTITPKWKLPSVWKHHRTRGWTLPLREYHVLFPFMPTDTNVSGTLPLTTCKSTPFLQLIYCHQTHTDGVKGASSIYEGTLHLV